MNNSPSRKLVVRAARTEPKGVSLGFRAPEFEKAEVALNEKNKASVVALNAEIRRTKARLLEEVPKLQRLAIKKVKGLSPEEFAARNDLVLALPDRIQAIPDGTAAPKQTGGWMSSASASVTRTEIKFDSDGRFDDEYFQESEQSSKFKQEYEMRRIKQDQGLDMISEGLDTLKDMAHDMNEELDRQVPLMDEIDDKVDKAAADLKNTNVRLKHTVTQLRSRRNFCIDIVLLCIVLGIAAYLYKASFDSKCKGAKIKQFALKNMFNKKLLIQSSLTQMILMPVLAPILREKKLLLVGLFFVSAHMFTYNIVWSY